MTFFWHFNDFQSELDNGKKSYITYDITSLFETKKKD